MKYLITKRVDAPSLADAIKQEAKGEIIDVTKEGDTPPGMGFSA